MCFFLIIFVSFDKSLVDLPLNVSAFPYSFFIIIFVDRLFEKLFSENDDIRRWAFFVKTGREEEQKKKRKKKKDMARRAT